MCVCVCVCVYVHMWMYTANTCDVCINVDLCYNQISLKPYSSGTWNTPHSSLDKYPFYYRKGVYLIIQINLCKSISLLPHFIACFHFTVHTEHNSEDYIMPRTWFFSYSLTLCVSQNELRFSVISNYECHTLCL